MTSSIFYKHIKNKEQIRHFFFIITRSIAGVVLTASTIAFQAIGTGSNPVTRSIKIKADQGPLIVDPWGKKLRGIGQHLYGHLFSELVQFISR